MPTRNALTLLVGIAVFTFVPASTSHADKNSQKFTSSISGTIVNIPLDLDADSCTTSGGVTVCTDFSSYFTSSAKGTGAAGGDSTGQAVEEYDPVSGSGCTFLGSSLPIASCTLTGTSETGCEFKSVASAIVSRDSATGDLLFETESTTVCEDLSSGPPFNSTAAANGTITGGTGKFSGATGTFTSVAHGQTLVSDPAGHGFTWFEGSSTGTITTP
jgi:hypothetical protein